MSNGYNTIIITRQSLCQCRLTWLYQFNRDQNEDHISLETILLEPIDFSTTLQM